MTVPTSWSSKPGCPNKIVLIMNGGTLKATGPNQHYFASVAGHDIVMPSWESLGLTIPQAYRVWRRVAEDYNFANVDVTTDDTQVLDAPGGVWNHPPLDADYPPIRRGWFCDGSWTYWYGHSAAGVGTPSDSVSASFLDGAASFAYLLETVSHEIGHSAGLTHQAQTSGGVYLGNYNPGGPDGWQPIMGTSFGSGAATRTTWYDGFAEQDERPPFFKQHDMDKIAEVFSFAPNAVGDSIGAASMLPNVGGFIAGVNGSILYHTDKDYWSFTTTGGYIDVLLSVWDENPNLDGRLEVRDGSDNILLFAQDGASPTAHLTGSLLAGSYYLVVRPQSPPDNGTPTYGDGTADYGNAGQYTLTGNLYPVGGGGGGGSGPHPVGVLTQNRYGVAGQRYGAFDGKVGTSGPHPVGTLTQNRFGIAGQRYGSFVGRTITYITVTDSIDVTVVETIPIQATHTVSDSIDVTVSETPVTTGIRIFILDTINVTVSESTAIAYRPLVSDSINIQLQETIGNGSSIVVSDSIDVSLAESASAYFHAIVSDVLSVAVSDTLFIAVTQVGVITFEARVVQAVGRITIQGVW